MILEPYKDVDEIADAVKRVASDVCIPDDSLILIVLDGAFMFAADLLRLLDGSHRIHFIKAKSYERTERGPLKIDLGGLSSEDVEGKTVLIVEDIIDSGETLAALCKEVRAFKPDEIAVAALLRRFKVENEEYKDLCDQVHVGMVIPDIFVVGYGLDYRGWFRDLPEIWDLEKFIVELAQLSKERRENREAKNY